MYILPGAIMLNMYHAIQVESGDMVLCQNDLEAVLISLDLSAQTMWRIKLNYFWALCYNACLVPVAAGVLYPVFRIALAPMLAGTAMALSSVSIVLSSLMLVRYRPPARQSGGSDAVSSEKSQNRGYRPPLDAIGGDSEETAATAGAEGDGESGKCNCPVSSAETYEFESRTWGAYLRKFLQGLSTFYLGSKRDASYYDEPLISNDLKKYLDEKAKAAEIAEEQKRQQRKEELERQRYKRLQAEIRAQVPSPPKAPGSVHSFSNLLKYKGPPSALKTRFFGKAGYQQLRESALHRQEVIKSCTVDDDDDDDDDDGGQRSGKKDKPHSRSYDKIGRLDSGNLSIVSEGEEGDDSWSITSSAGDLNSLLASRSDDNDFGSQGSLGAAGDAAAAVGGSGSGKELDTTYTKTLVGDIKGGVEGGGRPRRSSGGQVRSRNGTIMSMDTLSEEEEEREEEEDSDVMHIQDGTVQPQAVPSGEMDQEYYKYGGTECRAGAGAVIPESAGQKMGVSASSSDGSLYPHIPSGVLIGSSASTSTGSLTAGEGKGKGKGGMSSGCGCGKGNCKCGADCRCGIAKR